MAFFLYYERVFDVWVWYAHDEDGPAHSVRKIDAFADFSATDDAKYGAFGGKGLFFEVVHVYVHAFFFKNDLFCS
jgi:hypothetical protein